MFSFIGIVIINLLIFQPILQTNFSVLGYLDEVMALFFAIYFFLNLRKGNIRKFELNIILLIILILFVGLLGSFKYKYQLNFKVILTDIFLFIKYILTFLGANVFFNKHNSQKYVKLEIKFGYLLTLITFIFMVFNFIFGIPNMTYEIRYGLRSFQFIYGHAGTLKTITSFFVIFFIFDLLKNDNKKNIVYILLSFIILASTLRSRSFVTILIFILILFSYYIKKSQKVNNKILVVIMITMSFFVARSQIDVYFNNNTRTPRMDLLKGSITIMKECFPIGSGFATYGSYAASEYYSPLYYRFKFNNHYGMREDEGMFLTDNFWPIIMGQYGFLGIILYLILLLNLFKLSWMSTKNREGKATCLEIWIIMLFNSTVSSSFVNFTAVTYFYILALLINKKESINETQNNGVYTDI